MSSIWGYIAARYGFDVVLAITLASFLVGGLLFGFCTSLVLAMLVRFIFFGLTHGWVAIMGPYAASIAGDKRQQEVIGMIIAAGTGMQLVGPAISGWTYGLVPRFPALIPSLVGSCLASLAICFFCFQLGNGKAVWSAAGHQNGSADTWGRHSPIFQMLGRWPVPLIVLMRFSQGFAIYAIFEVVPLWLISDKEVGGLNMSEKQVGILLARSGLWNIFYFSLVLPRLSKRLGGRCTSNIVSMLGIVFCILLPFSTSELTANVTHLFATSACLSQAALIMAFTNNAAGQADRAIVCGFAVRVDLQSHMTTSELAL
eukprot:Skav209955  [mRNA]  locus=scaffold2335:1802:2743:- [translate_table: standard]